MTWFLLIYFSSRAVRQHWGTLVRSGVVKRDYRDISINNVITLGTRIRIVILRVSIVVIVVIVVVCHSCYLHDVICVHSMYKLFTQLPLSPSYKCMTFLDFDDGSTLRLNIYSFLIGNCWCLSQSSPEWLRYGNPISTVPTTSGSWTAHPPPYCVQLRRRSFRLRPSFANSRIT